MYNENWLIYMDKKSMSYKIALLCFVFLLSRISLILVLYIFFDGTEPAEDINLYYEIGLNPLTHYQGQSSIAAYPPLQGFFMWPIVNLFGLPAFGYWLRICFSLLELSIYISLLKWLPNNAKNFFRVLMLIFVPLPVLSTTIWGQEEILAFAFIYFGLITWQRRSYTLAITIWAFGVVTAKIYILPLLALGLLDCLRNRRYYDILISLGILIMGYLGRISGGASGFEGFMPGNHFTNSLWSMPIVSRVLAIHTQYSLSLLLCALWTCMCIAYWFFSRRFTSFSEMYALISMGIFLMFFHVNPEYFMLPYAALLAAFTFGRLPYRYLVFFGILLSCTWIHNILYMLCVSEKLLNCSSMPIYPYGSLLIANLSLVVAIILDLKILFSKQPIAG